MTSSLNQLGSREASCPPTTTNVPGFSRLIRCARRSVRLRSVVKLHCSPTTSGANFLQSARPCSSPSMRRSYTLHSCPSASRHAATQIGPSGSTKVSISRPRMPPTGGLTNATFIVCNPEKRSAARLFLLELREHELGDRFECIENAGAVHRHRFERRQVAL